MGNGSRRVILTTTPNAVTQRSTIGCLSSLNQTATICGSTRECRTSLISELLKPYHARLVRCYLVSSRINHVANDDEECSCRVDIPDPQNRLFV